MKPPFCRQGNKLPMIKELIPLIPEHTLYVETFVGSGALFFNIQNQNAVLNDLDTDLINAYELIKEVNIDNLLSYNFDTIESMSDFYFNKKIITLEDKLLFYRIKTSCGYRSKPVINKLYIYNNPLSTFKNIQFYKDKLRDVKLLNEDYKKVIHDYNDTNTFFFLDPPYENTANDVGYAEGSDTFNFEELKKICDTIKGTFLLTINDSPNIRELFKDYFIKSINVRNAGFNGKTNLKRIREELIITNYEL
jgi:DNA adenine methylase